MCYLCLNEIQNDVLVNAHDSLLSNILFVDECFTLNHTPLHAQHKSIIITECL